MSSYGFIKEVWGNGSFNNHTIKQFDDNSSSNSEPEIKTIPHNSTEQITCETILEHIHNCDTCYKKLENIFSNNSVLDTFLSKITLNNETMLCGFIFMLIAYIFIGKKMSFYYKIKILFLI